MRPSPFHFLVPALFALFSGVALAHPIPDVPVHASFEADGSVTIVVEVDPRCFSDDPLNEPSTLNWVLEEMTEAERDEERELARKFIRSVVEFVYDPKGKFVPEFTFKYTKLGGGKLKEIDDIVVLTGTWSGALPAGTTGYRLNALPVGELSVLFNNDIRGKPVKRKQVLFPGETSYLLSLPGLADKSSGD